MTSSTHMTPTAATAPPASKVVAILILESGHEIRADLLRRVKARIPELDLDRDYLLKQICGEDFWDPLPKADKIKGGKTIAYLVKTGQLPLEFANCLHAVPKRYRRR